MKESKPTRMKKLLRVIQSWLETESGPTLLTVSDETLQVKIKIRGYKRLTLERTFGEREARTTEEAD